MRESRGAGAVKTNTVVFDLRYATAHYPGVGSYAVGLSRALLEAHPRWPWRVLVPRQSDRFDLGFVPAEFRVPADPLAPFAGQFALGGRLRALDAALYHSPYFLRPWGAGCASIVTVHDTIPLESFGLKGARRAAYRWLASDALKAERVITDTEAARAAIELEFGRELKGGRAGSIRVASPGVHVAPAGAPWPAWPKPALLSVGINKPHKNLVTLIDALARIPEGNRPLLVAAGPVDPRYPDVMALARERGIERDVRALGRVPEERLTSLYRSANAFVMPTLAEGFGLPLLEALALGLPAIASNLPVLHEVAAEAAVYVPPLDPAAWAGAIEALMGDAGRRARLSALAIERARSFSYARAADQISAEYRALVPALSLSGAAPAATAEQAARGGAR